MKTIHRFALAAEHEAMNFPIYRIVRNFGFSSLFSKPIAQCFCLIL